MYEIIVWATLLIAVLPVAGILLRRAAIRRSGGRSSSPHGAHARIKPATGPEAVRELWSAVRFATISAVAALNLVFRPHGLVDWIGVGIVVIVLAWEPATWLTAYLVRRSNQKDSS